MKGMSPKIGFYRPHKRVFAPDGSTVDKKTGEVIPLPSRTKQEFKAECDINNVLKQYKQTGMVRHISNRAAAGAYQDLPDSIDFQESMNIVLAAQTAFSTLPSLVRERFGNDPSQFLAFMANPNNVDEAVKLGLATKTRIPQADTNGGHDKSPPPPPAPPSSPEPKKPPQGGNGG